MIRRSSDPTRSAIATLLVVAMTATTATTRGEPSAANIASAKSLVAEGRVLRTKGEHKTARDRFKAAYALVPTPIIGLDLAKEHVALGELIEAREVALDVTNLPASAKESADGAAARKDADTLAAELKGRIPSITVRVEGASSGATLSIDGESVPAAAIGAPRKINPGSHVVEVSVGAKKQTRKIEVAAGESREVAFAFAKDEAADASSTEPPKSAAPAPDGPTNNTWSYVAFGVGGVGLLVGGITGVMALSKKSKLDEDCGSGTCPPELHGELDSYNTLRTTAYVGLAIAAVGITVGLLTLRSDSSTPAKTAALRVENNGGGATLRLIAEF